MAIDSSTIEKLIELEVRARTAKTFDEEFDKRATAMATSFKTDIERFRSTMTKVGAAILGLLGISAFTNLSDLFGIPKKIDDKISARIEEMVKTSDIQSKYVSKLRSMFAENLVYSIEINNLKPVDKDEDDQSEKRRRQLQESDARFLLDHLFRDEPDEALAARIARVFRHASDKSKEVYKEQIFNAIAQLQRGTADEQRRFERILINTTYAASLIDGLKEIKNEFDVDVSNRLRPLLKDPRVAQRVRLAILEQLAKRKDVGAMDHFLEAAAQTDGPFRDAGLRGLAATRPKDDLLTKEIAKLRKDSPLAVSVPLMASLASTLCDVPQREDVHEDAIKEQKLKTIIDPLTEIVLFFAERTNGWSWPSFKWELESGSPRLVPTGQKFDLEISPLLLSVDIPSRTSYRRPLTGTEPVLHRDCAFAVSKILESAIATTQKDQVLKIARIFSIRELRALEQPRRATVQISFVLPSVSLGQDSQFKCDGAAQPTTVPKGSNIALSVEKVEGTDTLFGILNYGKGSAVRKRCAIESLESIRGNIALAEPGSS